MPKYSLGRTRWLDIVGTLFLVVTVGAISYVAANPSIQQLLSSQARYSPDALIRQRERTGNCKGADCLAPEIQNKAKLGGTLTSQEQAILDRTIAPTTAPAETAATPIASTATEQSTTTTSNTSTLTKSPTCRTNAECGVGFICEETLCIRTNPQPGQTKTVSYSSIVLYNVVIGNIATSTSTNPTPTQSLIDAQALCLQLKGAINCDTQTEVLQFSVDQLRTTDPTLYTQAINVVSGKIAAAATPAPQIPSEIQTTQPVTVNPTTLKVGLNGACTYNSTCDTGLTCSSTKTCQVPETSELQSQQTQIAAITQPKYDSKASCEADMRSRHILPGNNGSFAVCNIYLNQPEQLNGLDKITFGGFTPYVAAFQGPKAYQLAGFDSRDDYINDCVSKGGSTYFCTQKASNFTPEQAAASVSLGTTIVAEGAFISSGFAATSLASFLTTTVAIQSLTSTGNATSTCILKPGTNECYGAVGQAVISWANVGAIDAVAKLASVGTPLATNIARAVNLGITTTNGLNSGSQAVQACKSGNTLGCITQGGMTIVLTTLGGYQISDLAKNIAPAENIINAEFRVLTPNEVLGPGEPLTASIPENPVVATKLTVPNDLTILTQVEDQVTTPLSAASVLNPSPEEALAALQAKFDNNLVKVNFGEPVAGVSLADNEAAAANVLADSVGSDLDSLAASESKLALPELDSPSQTALTESKALGEGLALAPAEAPAVPIALKETPTITLAKIQQGFDDNIVKPIGDAFFGNPVKPLPPENAEVAIPLKPPEQAVSPELVKKTAEVVHPRVMDELVTSFKETGTIENAKAEFDSGRMWDAVYDKTSPAYSELRAKGGDAAVNELIDRLDKGLRKANSDFIFSPKTRSSELVHITYPDISGDRVTSMRKVIEFLRNDAPKIVEDVNSKYGLVTTQTPVLSDYFWLGLGNESKITFTNIGGTLVQQVEDPIQGALLGLAGKDVPANLRGGNNLNILEYRGPGTGDVSIPIPKKNINLEGNVVKFGENIGPANTPYARTTNPSSAVVDEIASNVGFDTSITPKKLASFLTDEQARLIGTEDINVDIKGSAVTEIRTESSKQIVPLGQKEIASFDATPFSEVKEAMRGVRTSPDIVSSEEKGFDVIVQRYLNDVSDAARTHGGSTFKFAGDGAEMVFLDGITPKALREMADISNSMHTHIANALAGEYGDDALAAAKFLEENFQNKIFVKVGAITTDTTLTIHEATNGYLPTEISTQTSTDDFLTNAKNFKNENGAGTGVVSISPEFAAKFTPEELKAVGLKLVQDEKFGSFLQIEEQKTLLQQVRDWVGINITKQVQPTISAPSNTNFVSDLAGFIVSPNGLKFVGGVTLLTGLYSQRDIINNAVNFTGKTFTNAGQNISDIFNPKEQPTIPNTLNAGPLGGLSISYDTKNTQPPLPETKKDIGQTIVDIAENKMATCVPGRGGLYNACLGEYFNGKILTPEMLATIEPTDWKKTNSLYNLFWCTQLVISSAQQAGIKLDFSTNIYTVQTMYDDFQKKGLTFPESDLTPDNIQEKVKPGMVAFINTPNTTKRQFDHVALIKDVKVINAVDGNGVKYKLVNVTIIQANSSVTEATYELTKNGKLIYKVDNKIYSLFAFGDLTNYGK